MRKLSTLFIFSIFSTIVYSQDCRMLGAVDVFHANEIRTNVMQRGNAFWDYDDAVFQVPFSGTNSPSTIFNSAVWLGGKDEQGIIKVIAQEYAQHLGCGFMPGPLMSDTPLNDDGVKNWNRNFQVTRFEIEQHQKDAMDGQIDHPIDDIFGWPATDNGYFESIHGFALDLGPQGGAGFIEVDGHRNDKYEPQFGEYPHVRGLSELAKPVLISWNVYNSARDQIELNDGDPLICEIQETTYAFNCDADSEETDLLNHSLFQQFLLTSLSKDQFEGVKLGIWVDPDLGCYTDDYIGSSPQDNTVYWYNEDNEDGTVGVECNSGVLSYGENPPAMGLTFLSQEMSSLAYYMWSELWGHPAISGPQVTGQYYNYMDAKWNDGRPLTRGGRGYNPNSTDTVRHAYSDPPDDPDGWSMFVDKPSPADYRFIATADVGEFDEGKSWTLDVVYHYNRIEGNDHIDNALSTISRSQWFSEDLLVSCTRRPLCDCNCVWPGDTDQSGAVTYKDAVNIIFGLGATGATRSDPFPFAPRDVSDWGTPLIEGLDARFADVDGNGVITEDDFELFQVYLDQSNACRIEDQIECPQGPEVYFDFSKSDSLYSTGLNRGHIRIKSKREFVGVSYEVQLDEELQELILMSPGLSWKDTSISDLSFDHKLVDGGMTRAQGIVMNKSRIDAELSGSSDNSVGHLVLVHQELPKSYHSDFVEIRICDFTVYYEDGSKERLPSMSQRYYLPDSVVVTSVKRPSENQIKIYPNPSKDGVWVNGYNDRMIGYEWYTLEGRSLQSGNSFEGEMIEFHPQTPGMYLLKISTGRETIVRKVIFD